MNEFSLQEDLVLRCSKLVPGGSSELKEPQFHGTHRDLKIFLPPFIAMISMSQYT